MSKPIITPFPLLNVVRDLRMIIYSYLNPFHLSQCIQTCKTLKDECSSDIIWRRHLEDAFYILEYKSLLPTEMQSRIRFSDTIDSKLVLDDGEYSMMRQYYIVSSLLPHAIRCYNTETGTREKFKYGRDYCLHLYGEMYKDKVPHKHPPCKERIGLLRCENDTIIIDIAGVSLLFMDRRNFRFTREEEYSTVDELIRNGIKVRGSYTLPPNSEMAKCYWRCSCQRIHGPGVPFFTLESYRKTCLRCCEECEPKDEEELDIRCPLCIKSYETARLGFQSKHVHNYLCENCRGTTGFIKLNSNITGDEYEYLKKQKAKEERRKLMREAREKREQYRREAKKRKLEKEDPQYIDLDRESKDRRIQGNFFSQPYLQVYYN